MSETWQKRILVVAAAWNVLGGISALLLARRVVLLAAGIADFAFAALFALIVLGRVQPVQSRARSLNFVATFADR